MVNIRQTCEQREACVRVSGTNWGAMSARWQEGSSGITSRRVDKAPASSSRPVSMGPWRQELPLIRGVERVMEGGQSPPAAWVEGVGQQFDSIRTTIASRKTQQSQGELRNNEVSSSPAVENRTSR